MRLRIKLLMMFCIALLTILLLATTALADDEDIYAGVITGTSVNVRETPTVNGKWLLTLSQNVKVVIMAHEDNWYKIGYNGTIGYVAADYVTPYSSGTSDYGYGAVIGSVVNIRSIPNTDGTRVGALVEGVNVRIIGVENGWYKIKCDSVTGYVAGSLIEPAKVSVSSAPASRVSVSEGQRIVNMAKKYLGVPYIWGGVTPGGFDCSGYTQYVFAKCGYTLNYRTQQYRNGIAISYSNLRPGDLVFFATGSTSSISHVGIYIGNGKFIHAPRAGDVVKVSSMTSGTYYYYRFRCARRIV